jgi:hypothetical protein
MEDVAAGVSKRGKSFNAFSICRLCSSITWKHDGCRGTLERRGKTFTCKRCGKYSTKLIILHPETLEPNTVRYVRVATAEDLVRETWRKAIEIAERP